MFLLHRMYSLARNYEKGAKTIKQTKTENDQTEQTKKNSDTICTQLKHTLFSPNRMCIGKN